MTELSKLLQAKKSTPHHPADVHLFFYYMEYRP